MDGIIYATNGIYIIAIAMEWKIFCLGISKSIHITHILHAIIESLVFGRLCIYCSVYSVCFVEFREVCYPRIGENARINR